MIHYYLAVLKKYAVFSGRARRAEYWYFVLCNSIIGFILGLIGSLLGTNLDVLAWIYLLAILLPSIAAAVRRLHDTNRSGWWYLIGFIPLIGYIFLLIFLVEGSQPGENKYGPNPKEIKAS